MSQKMIVRSFWSIFLVVYFIVGYIRQAIFVKIDDATLWDKFVTIYVRGFILNIVPAFIIALILGFVLNYYMTNRSKSVQSSTKHKKRG